MRRLLTLMSVVVVGVALSLGASAVCPADSAQSKWVITDLGTLGGGFSEAFAINDRGQVVGWSSTKTGGTRAFLWENGKMTDLGTLGGPNSAAVAINDRGQVVGWSETRDTSMGVNIRHGFLWQNGRMTDLSTLGESLGVSPRAINNRGQIVGETTVFGADGPDSRAFLWQSGRMRDLAPNKSGSAVAINNRGQVVVGLAPGWFLWENGKMTDLGKPGGPYSGAVAINDSGRITLNLSGRAVVWESGKSTTVSGWKSRVLGLNNGGQIIGSYIPERRSGYPHNGHACLWQNGKLVDLTPSGSRSGPVAINARGQVIGWTKESLRTSAKPGAFVWQDGHAVELGNLGHPGITVNAINDHGQIVGSANTGTDREHAVLWTLRL